MKNTFYKLSKEIRKKFEEKKLEKIKLKISKTNLVVDSQILKEANNIIIVISDNEIENAILLPYILILRESYKGKITIISPINSFIFNLNIASSHIMLPQKIRTYRQLKKLVLLYKNLKSDIMFIFYNPKNKYHTYLLSLPLSLKIGLYHPSIEPIANLLYKISNPNEYYGIHLFKFFKFIGLPFKNHIPNFFKNLAYFHKNIFILTNQTPSYIEKVKTNFSLNDFFLLTPNINQEWVESKLPIKNYKTNIKIVDILKSLSNIENIIVEEDSIFVHIVPYYSNIQKIFILKSETSINSKFKIPPNEKMVIL